MAEKPEWETDFEQLTNSGSAPHEGYFKMRLKRGGPWIPARIYRSMPTDPETGELLDRSWVLAGEINGLHADYRHVWVWGHDIEKEQYEWLIAITALKTV